MATTFIKKLAIPGGKVAELYVDLSNGDVYYSFGHSIFGRGNWYLGYVQYKDGNFKAHGSKISDGELGERIKKDWDAR